jgi:hypothetical protein
LSGLKDRGDVGGRIELPDMGEGHRPSLSGAAASMGADAAAAESEIHASRDALPLDLP